MSHLGHRSNMTLKTMMEKKIQLCTDTFYSSYLNMSMPGISLSKRGDQASPALLGKTARLKGSL